MHLRTLRPTAGLVALAAFWLGGLVAPALHGVEHTAEWADARDAHLGAGHHHHAASETHKAEVDAPCPEPLALDLLCVLCQGVSVYVPVAPVAIDAALARGRAGTTEHLGFSSFAVGTCSIRGPPGPVT